MVYSKPEKNMRKYTLLCDTILLIAGPAASCPPPHKKPVLPLCDIIVTKSPLQISKMSPRGSYHLHQEN